MMPRPVLRYFGGKYRLAPWIVGHFPAHRIYVEPFGGAASVLLCKPRSKVEVYNDLCDEVVRLFRVLRDRSEPFLRACELTPYSRAEWEQTWQEPPADEIEAARRYAIRSWASYGCSAATSQGATGFRRSSSGQQGGSHPAGDWANWPRAMRTVVARLRGVVIDQVPAIEAVTRYDGPETLHYVDPPYIQSTRNRPDHHYRHEMSEDDHRELLDVLRQVRGHAVLSGYRHPIYDEALADWPRVDKAARVDGGGSAIESLWLHPRTAEAMQGTQQTIEGVA